MRGKSIVALLSMLSLADMGGPTMGNLSQSRLSDEYLPWSYQEGKVGSSCLNFEIN